MGEIIKVDSASLEEFKASFAQAGEEYKANLARLTNFITEITRGDIQGDPANDILNKFEEKRATFNNIASLIDDGEDYLGIKGKKFETTLSEIQSSVK
ncbi:MAG: hypothetical protein E7160_04465 [Firmicutes bacterium]|nr:hypothetical protein [Bacillota bacterium]